jgi:hypothetical protein
VEQRRRAACPRPGARSGMGVDQMTASRSGAAPVPDHASMTRRGVRSGAVPGRCGSDYLCSLGGRRTYLGGRLVCDPVCDPTQDPGMSRMARWLAGYLDACQVPSPLVRPDGVPHAYALTTSAADIAPRGRAFAETARRSGGLMGRSPDFLATILTGWRAAAEHFGPATPQEGQAGQRTSRPHPSGSLKRNRPADAPPRPAQRATPARSPSQITSRGCPGGLARDQPPAGGQFAAEPSQLGAGSSLLQW